jgi:glycine dehydrogenase subunit 1
MDYTQFTEQDVQSMLATIGVDSIEALFAPIPDSQRLNHPLNIPRGVSELELLADLDALAKRNTTCDALTCFLGGGAADHFIPSLVDELADQAEFRTAYTPYQAEASQGSLQAFFEYQTMLCMLTGMEVSNASLYEQASAVAEAVLMARAVTRRSRVLISEAVHPDALIVLDTYVREQPIDIVRIPRAGGLTDLSALRDALNDQTAAVVVQSPTHLGGIEPLGEIAAAAHKAGALAIASIDPISCGILKPPGAFDIDIVVGEGQPLGIPLSYGGPYCGFLTCREKFLRKLPGRVVGLAKDGSGKTAFCLALQTREQHIKRERATSNICTNQGLMAMRVAVYLAAMGKNGLAKVASLCLDKAHYAAEQIAALPGYNLRFDAPFFKEFVVQTDRNVERLMDHCRSRNILAGVPLDCWYRDLADCFLVTVTEKRTKAEIDALVAALKSVK